MLFDIDIDIDVDIDMDMDMNLDLDLDLDHAQAASPGSAVKRIRDIGKGPTGWVLRDRSPDALRCPA